jgi:hypothetical protein
MSKKNFIGELNSLLDWVRVLTKEVTDMTKEEHKIELQLLKDHLVSQLCG